MTLGIDIVKVERMKRILKKKNLDRYFTLKELEKIEKSSKKEESLSALFASKEALSKALGLGIWKMGLKNVEILNDDRGKPYYHILNKEKIPYQDEEVDLSISHDGGICVAVCKINVEPSCNRSYDKDLISNLKPRLEDSHKGSYGRIGILGGSKGMSGSCYLASMAALRTGSGLVYSLVPESISTIMEIKSLENIVIPIESQGGDFKKTSFSEIYKKTKTFDALAIGPGMGRGEEVYPLLEEMVTKIDLSLVIDADGLNALSENPDLLKKKKRQIILTPHPLEMARLSGKTIEELSQDRVKIALEFAKKQEVVLVLKGHKTLVTNGHEIYLNPSGNPGMATAGSGDVLTGMIVSLLGQGYEPMVAGKLGVYLHGLAGDFASEDLGQDGMLAGDIIGKIPTVLKEIWKL